MAGVLAIDLIAAGWGLIPAMSDDFYHEDGSWAQGIRDVIGNGRLYTPLADENELKYQRFFDFGSFTSSYEWPDMRNIALADANLLDNIPVVNNYDPFVPGEIPGLDGSIGRFDPRTTDFVV